MNKTGRPLSPHLQIYKPQLTSVLSILHRITGIGLVFVGVSLVAWVMAGAYGSDCYGYIMACMHHPVGKLMGFLSIYTFFYHLLNGLRHLGWDMIWGFDLKTTYLTGWGVVALSFLFSFLYYMCF